MKNNIIIWFFGFCLFSNSIFANHLAVSCDDLKCDEPLSQKLIQNGVKYETSKAIIWVEKGSLTQEEIHQFGTLVEQGITNIEKFLKNNLDVKKSSGRKLQYFVSPKIDVSHVYYKDLKGLYDPKLFMPSQRVKDHNAPYLHETAHILAGDNSEWFSEGFASYIESYVSENMGGYSAHIFDLDGNKGIDEQAAKAIRTKAGKAAIQLIGDNEKTLSLSSNDQTLRAAAYVLYQSAVKFLIKNVSLEKTMQIYREKGTEKSFNEVTNHTLEEWKTKWIQHLTTGNK